VDEKSLGANPTPEPTLTPKSTETVSSPLEIRAQFLSRCQEWIRTRDWQKYRKGLSATGNGLSSFVTKSTVVLVVVAASLLVLLKLTEHATVSIEPISVPDEFKSAGYTPEVAAARMRDSLIEIATIQNSQMKAFHTQRQLPSIVIPTLSISADSIATVLRGLLGVDDKRKVVSGEIVKHADKRYRLLMRINGREVYPTHEVQNIVEATSLAEIDSKLLRSAAPEVLKGVHPYLFLLYEQAMGRRNNELISKAKQLLMDNRNDDGELSWIYAFIGILLHENEEFARATPIYKYATQLNPKLSIAHSNLGNISFAQQKFEEAAEHYNAAIRSDPLFSSAYSRLAMSLARLDEYQQTQQAAERRQYLESSSYNWYLYASIAIEMQSRPLLRRSVAMYRRAIELNPSEERNYLGLADILQRLGEREGAERELHRAKVRFLRH